MIKKTILRFYQNFTVKRIKSVDQGPPDVEAWLAFLENLPKNKDPYTQSYNKYLCRRYYLDFIYLLSMNLSAMLLLFPSLAINWFRGRKKVKKTPCAAVLVQDKWVDYDDIFPQELRKQYIDLVVVKREQVNPALNDDGLKLFLKNFKKHPFQFYYNYLVLRELSFFFALRELYDPEAIIVYVNERNIASPLIKEMLEQRGVQWISFMHGDYLLQLIQAYMSFSIYYVWDAHYIPMFEEILKVDCNEYVIYTPERLKNDYSLGEKKYDVTYYLGIENRKRLEAIAFALKKIEAAGWSFLVRPHPRSSDMDLVKQIFPSDKIEDPSLVSPKESLNRTRYAASLNSTVLMQAYYGGIGVIIDDYSDKQRYNSLEKRRYIMLEKEHRLLSEFINEEIKENQ